MIAPTLDKSKRHDLTFEVRELNIKSDSGGDALISGYAAVFNKPSEDLGGFVERIMPGAFANTLKENASDPLALFNHDTAYVLGRRSAGTLTLSEDKRGLYFEITPPNTQWANDLATSMKRGDIKQMSFGFRTLADKWSDLDKPVAKRDLLEVALMEISVVAMPAYKQTSANIRTLANGTSLDAFEEMVGQLERGDGLDSETNLRYIEIVQYFRSLGEPGAEPVPDNQPGAEPVDLDEWRKLIMDSDMALAGFKV